MALLGINEAARAAGVARSTIQRKIKSGELSVTRSIDGTRGIDTSELIRVFGELQGGRAGSEAAQSRPAGGPVSQLAASYEALEREVALLREQLSASQQRETAAQEREEWYRERISALEQRLLPAPQRGLVERLGELVDRVRGRSPR